VSLGYTHIMLDSAMSMSLAHHIGKGGFLFPQHLLI